MLIYYNNAILQCSNIVKSQWNVNTTYCQHNNLNPSNSFNNVNIKAITCLRFFSNHTVQDYNHALLIPVIFPL